MITQLFYSEYRQNICEDLQATSLTNCLVSRIIPVEIILELIALLFL